MKTMMNSKTTFGTSLALVGLYLAIGCTSTTTGNEGNLDFSYTADDDIRNFNKPIAVGAKLELRVHETGTRLEVDVEDATSDDNDTLAVETFARNRIILEGVGEGPALIEVTAKVPGGEVLTDSVNMLAARPDILELRHSCTGDAGPAKYLVGTDGALISYDFKKSNGQDVIGYGYFPFEVSGDAELTLNQTSTDQANFHFDIGTMPGTATIASTLDESTIDLDIVLPGDIDGIEGNPSAVLRLSVGDTRYFSFWPTVAGDRVCQSEEEVQAETSTPEICTVRATAPVDPDSSGAFDLTGWVAVEGLSFGNCDFTVTFPNGAGGEGVSAEFTAAVGDFPDADDDA